MADQVNYYDQFARQHEADILACPEPAYWTTDYQGKGRVYQEIKKRVESQLELVMKYFSIQQPVLDIGCGFGRQAILLGKKGFTVTGIDTSNYFISIANKLFTKLGLRGRFECTDILGEANGTEKFKQILLLDVLEHIRTGMRVQMFKKIFDLAEPGALLIISVPVVKQRLTSRLNNSIRRRITQHIPYFLRREEHPYPIPVKKDIFKMTENMFIPVDQFDSGPTDFFVLKRK